MSQFAPEDSRGAIDFVSDGDITFEADRNQDGAGDLVFRTAGVERARIKHDGSGTGWPNVLGGVIPSNALGIVADGVTDNTTLLTSLFAEAATTGMVTLPAGSIIYSSPIPIVMGEGGVVIQGLGECTKLIGPGLSFIGTVNAQASGDRGLTVRDLWLCGDNDIDSARGLDLFSISDVVLDGVKITGYSHQVVADQVQNLDIRKGCRFTARTGTDRTDTCGTTSGSPTVTDTAIALTDAGKPVSGTGIPPMSYVGAVSAGVSFALVDERGASVNATATNASVSLTIGGGTIGGLWIPYGADAHGTAYPNTSPFHTSVDPNGSITTNIVRVAASFVWSANPRGYPIIDDSGLQHDFSNSQCSYGRSSLRLCGTDSVRISQADWEGFTNTAAGATITTAAVTQKGTARAKAGTVEIGPGNYFGCVPRSDSCGTTSGSATVTDASCVAADLGNPVSGTGIPANSYIGSVSPGVSFTLIDSTGASVNATATNASVTLKIGNGQIDCSHLDTLILHGNAFTQPSQAVVKYVQSLTTLIGQGNSNNGTGSVVYDNFVKTSNGGLQWTVGRTGSALLRANLSVFGLTATGITSSGAIVFSALPIADPHVVGELWSNSGVVTVSAG